MKTPSHILRAIAARTSLVALFVVCCLAITATAATANLDSLVQHAPGLEAYPQASSVVVFDHRVTTLDGNGRTHVQREYLCKILDERAKSSIGDQSIHFDGDQDTVIIEAARTRLPSGQWIEPEARAFSITSAPEVQWASAYSQVKQQNISFPGMSVGAALYLSYRIEPRPGSKAPDYPHEGGSVLFGGYEPYLDKSFTFRSAKRFRLQFEMQNGEVPVARSADGDDSVYVWSKQNCAQIISEPSSVGLSDLVPRLVYTTFPDWSALDDYIANRFWSRVDSSQEAVNGYLSLTSPELRGRPAAMQAAMWMLWNIRNVDLDFGQAGYEPHTADKVWQNKYGDPSDKCVLLTAILRSYGLAPMPVLVPGYNTPFSNLPVLEQFHHIILAVPVGEDTVWLDPTASYYPPGNVPYNCTYGKGCLLVAGAPLIMNVPTGNSATSTGTFTEIRTSLNAKGDLSGFAVCRPEAERAARARAQFKDQKAQERDIYSQRTASRIADGTKVTEFSTSKTSDLSEPVVVKLGFESPGFAVRQGDMMLLNTPGNPFDFAGTGFYPSLPEVRYPVSLPPRGKATMEFSVIVPDGFKVTYVPPPLVLENPFIYMELKVRHDQQTLTWTQVTEIKADKVPVKDYKAFRDAFMAYAMPKNRLAILEGGTVSRKSN
jgi:hypothetical protein